MTSHVLLGINKEAVYRLIPTIIKTDNDCSITFKDPNPASDASRISEKGPSGPIDLENGAHHMLSVTGHFHKLWT